MQKTVDDFCNPKSIFNGKVASTYESKLNIFKEINLHELVKCCFIIFFTKIKNCRGT